MARPRWIEFAGARYYVIARGNERKTIDRDAADCCRFLEILQAVVSRSQCAAPSVLDNDQRLMANMET